MSHRKFFLTSAELYRQYWIEQKTAPEIALKEEVSHNVVTRWMRKYGIPLRTKAEARRGELNPFWDKQHHPHSKIKISLKNKGKQAWNKGLTRETDARVEQYSKTLQGHVESLETRMKIGVSMIGKNAGEKHSRWKGGRLPYYGPNWLQQRKKARERDQICQFYNCTITQQQGRELDVHHIISFRYFGLERYEEANDLQNLISYCHRHHVLVEAS